MTFDRVRKNLEDRGFAVNVFSTGAEAAEYLNSVIDDTSVGFGGSATLDALGLYDSLSRHNETHWHWKTGSEERQNATAAAVYLSSANGLAETGEIVNIDGCGNRVAGTLFGPKRVYFVIGKNKLAPTFEEALWRARNIAAPKNARRLGVNTPCAVKGDRCFNCDSPQRICRGLVVLWRPMTGSATEVILVDEPLGM